MSGVFSVAANGEGAPVLAVEPGALSRRDVHFREAEGLEVLVVGYPHTEGSAWVTPDYVAREYTRAGRLDPAGIHGFFVIVVVDGSPGLVTIANDRFSCYDVFTCRAGDRVAFSDSVETLASWSGGLTADGEGLRQFLLFGHFLDTRTHFVEIRKMPCATVTILGPGGSEESREYWRLGESGHEPGSVEVREAVDMLERHLGELFELGGDVTVSLTGGLDSRSVTAACLPHRERLRCFSYGGGGNRDVAIAKRVCGAAGVPHTVYDVNDEESGGLEKRALSAARGTSAMVNFILLSNLDWAYAGEARRAEALLTGIGSDLFRAYWVRGGRERPADRGKILPTAICRWRRARSELLAGVRLEEALGEALSLLERELAGIELADRDLAAEYLCQRIRNANMATYITFVAGEKMVIWDTWLYGPLNELATGLEFDARMRREVLRTLVQGEPGLARIPTGKGQAAGLEPLGPRGLSTSALHVMGDYYRKAVNKVARGVLNREPVGLSYTVDYTMVLRRNRRFVERYMSPEDTILSWLLDPAAVAGTRDLVLRGYGNNVYEATNVMCLEIWLRHIAGITAVREPRNR